MQLVFEAVGIRNLSEPKILHITSETEAHNKTKGTTAKGEEQSRMRGWESKASVQPIFALEAEEYTQYTLRSYMGSLLFKLAKVFQKGVMLPNGPLTHSHTTLQLSCTWKGHSCSVQHRHMVCPYNRSQIGKK